MALSPSIPTSFVPKQPVSTTKRRYSGGNNILLIIASVIFVAALAASAGVFLYSTYLQSVEKSKASQLVAAESGSNQDTIEQFLRLSNRFTAAKTILANHVALSQFLTLLSTVTVQDVHFDSLDVAVAADRTATIQMVGEAKDFNALASESSVFASQKYIKSAIFSGIAVNKNNSVSFNLSANLDPAVVIESVAPAPGSVVAAATSSAATTTPTFALPASAVPSATTTPSATKAATTTTPKVPAIVPATSATPATSTTTP